MSTLTAEDAVTLQPLDWAVEQLSTTEPLEVLDVDTGSHVEFTLANTWNDDYGVESDTGVVPCSVKVGTRELGFTKEGLLTAGSLVGITKAYALNMPGRLMEPHFNHLWGAGTPEKSFKFLVSDDVVLATTKSATEFYSNLLLLERIVEQVKLFYRIQESDLRVDSSKFLHDLIDTKVRLVVPEVLRTLKSDTPQDDWSMGLQFQNSLTGNNQTSIDGFLFRWICANGMTTTLTSSGAWHRKNGDAEHMFDWATDASLVVLEGLEADLDMVQSLTSINIDPRSTASTMHDIFRRYKVPKAAQTVVADNIINSEDYSMYGILNAVTAAANDRNLRSTAVDRLLHAGGSISADWSHGKLVFEAVEAGENLDLEGEVTVEVEGREIDTRIAKLPSGS